MTNEGFPGGVVPEASGLFHVHLSPMSKYIEAIGKRRGGIVWLDERYYLQLGPPIHDDTHDDPIIRAESYLFVPVTHEIAEMKIQTRFEQYLADCKLNGITPRMSEITNKDIQDVLAYVRGETDNKDTTPV